MTRSRSENPPATGPKPREGRAPSRPPREGRAPARPKGRDGVPSPSAAGLQGDGRDAVAGAARRDASPHRGSGEMPLLPGWRPRRGAALPPPRWRLSQLTSPFGWREVGSHRRKSFKMLAGTPYQNKNDVQCIVFGYTSKKTLCILSHFCHTFCDRNVTDCAIEFAF